VRQTIKLNAKMRKAGRCLQMVVLAVARYLAKFVAKFEACTSFVGG
jgi:hypothetical protein